MITDPLRPYRSGGKCGSANDTRYRYFKTQGPSYTCYVYSFLALEANQRTLLLISLQKVSFVHHPFIVITKLCENKEV